MTDLAKLEDTQLLARGFLETKLYEHGSWLEFMSLEQRNLLAVPEEHWNDDWLQRLHLFTVVVRDAERSKTSLSDQAPSLDGELGTLFEILVSKQRQSLSTLLSSYAEHDAAAMWRIAEGLHIDLPDVYPEIILSNSDQPPFFAIIQARAEEDTHRVGLWASLFSEASLRSLVVAETCSKMQPLRGWAQHYADVPRNRRWVSRGALQESLLTQCLSIACGREGVAWQRHGRFQKGNCWTS